MVWDVCVLRKEDWNRYDRDVVCFVYGSYSKRKLVDSPKVVHQTFLSL